MYFTLIASLPHLPAHFDVDRPPVTRPRLEQLLKMVHEEDARVLQQLTDFLHWDRQPIDQTDDQVVQRYERLKEQTHHPLVLEVVEHRINVRTIVSALRRQRDGSGPPVGVGRLVEPIRRHWHAPQFGLQRRFPWIEEFAELMVAGEAVRAERVLFEFTWRTWCRMSTGFTFSFEAVLLYLARWSIVDRWTSRNAETGRTRFDQLVEETLGEFTTLQL